MEKREKREGRMGNEGYEKRFKHLPSFDFSKLPAEKKVATVGRGVFWDARVGDNARGEVEEHGVRAGSPNVRSHGKKREGERGESRRKRWLSSTWRGSSTLSCTLALAASLFPSAFSHFNSSPSSQCVSDILLLINLNAVVGVLSSQKLNHHTTQRPHVRRAAI
jgi:hypothetical protein